MVLLSEKQDRCFTTIVKISTCQKVNMLYLHCARFVYLVRLVYLIGRGISHICMKSLRYEFTSRSIADRVQKRQMHSRTRILCLRERCIADASGCRDEEKRREGTGEPSVSMGAPWYAPVRFSTVNGGSPQGRDLK